jgi:hypothetical protein
MANDALHVHAEEALEDSILNQAPPLKRTILGNQ